MLRAVCLLLIAALAGCGNTIAGVALMDDGQLREQPTRSLANVYGTDVWGGGNKIEAELRRREAFTDDEWTRIKAKAIRVGDSADLVAAAWGKPDTRTTYTSASGSSQIWRWDGGSTVWIEGDRVTMVRN